MKCLLILATVVFFHSCRKAENENTAFLQSKNGAYEIKIRGTRFLASHNVTDLFKNRTYKDSIVLQVPLREGIVSGNKIPVRKGYHKLGGRMILTKEKLVVDLHIIDTDDKQLKK